MGLRCEVALTPVQIGELDGLHTPQQLSATRRASDRLVAVPRHELLGLISVDCVLRR